MTLRVRTRRRRTALVIAGVFAVVLGVSLSITRPWQPPVETAPVAAAQDGVAPAPLALPEHPTLLVFGDSWTYGAAASVPTLGYAYVLADLIGGETIVDGVPGSGYLRPGSTGPAFGERIAGLDPRLDVDAIIIQGSINDRREDAAALPAAVNAAWDALTQKFPEVPVVVLGPAPHELPVGTSTARIDRELAALAGSRGWWYVSPVEEQWITPDNYLSVIDVGVGRKHPSTAGHRYLAEKVAEALERLGAAPVTAAEGEHPDPAK
ncbi:SGNH/GDSL hydrolase family protein [Microbacterium sp.]|uniref:SGNH/GDSL hydrolase family protein n=1 Tax=Microbacterium sp. TaxID=51671 RepID=UPI002811AD85|nr:SGNH/GDSL hydrolase family protein [Microbacterium sp.]